MSMEILITLLTADVGRLVIDKTGISGPVDFHLVFAPEVNQPGAPAPPSADGVPVSTDPSGPSIFTALEQQMGLKLENSRGSSEYLVIDSISRPSEN